MNFYKKYIKKNETIKSCLDAGLDLKLYNYNIWYVDDLLNESYKNMEYVGETIERKAKEKLVNFKFEPQYVNFYSYLMREVMRNVIEHSKSQKLILLIYKKRKI